MKIFSVNELAQKLNKLKQTETSKLMDGFVCSEIFIDKIYDYSIIWNLHKVILLGSNPLKNIVKLQKLLNTEVRDSYSHSSKMVNASTLVDLDDFINQLELNNIKLDHGEILWFKHAGMDKLGIILFCTDLNIVAVYD